MHALIRTTLLVGLVAACHQTATEGPDAAGGSADAATASGLFVQWVTVPSIPGDAGNNVTVATMLFRIDNLRLIGDAGPGDPRTSRSSFNLEWVAGGHPEAAAFMDAPTGLYSKVTLLSDGHLVDYSYEITGTVRFNDITHPYKIHDRDLINVSLSTSTMLDPGSEAHVPIRIALQDALGVVDFTSLTTDAGSLELDTFDSQMPAFRAKLIDSFSVSDN